MKMTRLILILSLGILNMQSYSQSDPNNYFQLPQPKLEPEIFNPSALNFQGGSYFNAIFNAPKNDEFYFTKVGSREDIYYSKKNGNTWTSPERVSFSIPDFHDADPFFSEDGKRLYFVSSRPTSADDKNYDYNIWYVARRGNKWGKPVVLPEPINSEYEEYFFSISEKGNVFFASNRPGGNGSFDIYTAKFIGNRLSEPVNIGAPISSQYYEYDPYISPDEQFIIYSIKNKPGGSGGSDIYVGFRDANGAWTEPKNLGSKINSASTDFAPSVSPDGKFIFYSTGGRMKWISSKILEGLKDNRQQ